MKNILILAGAVALVTTLGTTDASAQTLNMNMNWGVQSQLQLQRQGDMTAAATAQAYYQYMQWYRRTYHYDGPSLPTGVTAETMRNSMQALQRSMDAYHASAMNNSNRTSNAVGNWDLRAVRGCYVAADAYGRPFWYCPR